MNPLAANPGLAYRLALIVDGVCRVVAGHIGRDRTAGPTIILVCNDIRRRFLRLAKLMEQVQLGILPRTPLRPRAPAAAASGAGACGARAGDHVRVPRAKGFLLKLMRAAPWEVAVFGSQLQYWLTDPAASSFVSSYPQARRILRPIWRMLSRDPLPAVLREPEREAAAAPATTPPQAAPPGVAPHVVEPQAVALVGAKPPGAEPQVVTPQVSPASAVVPLPVEPAEGAGVPALAAEARDVDAQDVRAYEVVSEAASRDAAGEACVWAAVDRSAGVAHSPGPPHECDDDERRPEAIAAASGRPCPA